MLALISQHEEQILSDWLQEAGGASVRVSDAGRRAMRVEAVDIMASLREALTAGGDPDQFHAAAFAPVRQTLESLSRSRASQGQSAGDTSAFVLAFKRPLFALLQKKGIDAQQQMVIVITAASELSRNTLRHGGGGQMRWELLDDGIRRGLRLHFEDQGKGIADTKLALTDGWTSGGGMGLGLPGSKRLVHEFELQTVPGSGTRVSITRWK